MRKGGSLAFLITGSVFKNESSQGFRRWQLKNGSNYNYEPFQVELVEDYKEIRPFEDVANWPTLLVIRRNDKKTEYPVLYRTWSKLNDENTDGSILACRNDLSAIPVPGTDAGPWLVGTNEQIDLWKHLFSDIMTYQARKGITTDANGIYFVSTAASKIEGCVEIENDPSIGRRRGIAKRSVTVEKDDVFPLLRGRDIKRFGAVVPKNQAVIVPQRGMFGDEDLPSRSPRTYSYLAFFKSILESRSSYRRFQSGRPFWSIWSTGDYTFSSYKVVWKEMSGNRFVAAYVSDAIINGIDKKTVIPDHKVYFVPVNTEDEAAYLTGFLNAPLVSTAISAYASALSLGTSVVGYLHIPRYNEKSKAMRDLSLLAKAITNSEREQNDSSDSQLNELVRKIVEE